MVRPGATAQQRGGYCGTEQFNSPRLCVAMRNHRNQRLGTARLFREIRFQFCYQMLAESSSTTLRFCIREPRPCGDLGIPDSGFASRLPVQCSKPHHFNHSMRSSTASTTNLFIFLDFISLAFDRFRHKQRPRAKPERAARKIRHAAGLYLPAGDLAANDLAVWALHQLSGQCRCARE